MLRLRHIASGFALACSALSAGAAQTPAANNSARIDNINRAAAEIATIQAERGTDGAIAAVNACYRRELASAKVMTPGVEGCIAQDMIVSKVSSAFYASMPELTRKQIGAPDPDTLTVDMVKRISVVFRRLAVPDQEAIALARIVNTSGMETYGKTRFPGQFPEKKN